MAYSLIKKTQTISFFTYIFIALIYSSSPVCLVCIASIVLRLINTLTVRFSGPLRKFQTQVTQHTRKSNLYTLYYICSIPILGQRN